MAEPAADAVERLLLVHPRSDPRFDVFFAISWFGDRVEGDTT